MTSTTDNFNLPLYDTGDPANLRDQYNSAVRSIDNELKKSVDTTATALGAAGDAKKKAEAAQSAANTATTIANDAVGRLNALSITDNDAAGASKTRWDGAATLAAANKTNINAIDDNLNALHANTTENANSLYEKITTAQTSLQNSPIVFIGDSITQGYGATTPATDRWPTLLCNYYHATQINHAVGGSGFTVNGSQANGRFDIQAQTCANDNSFDHSQVRGVFIAGGVNDGAVSDYTAADQAATACVSTIRHAFPNAKIYVIVGLSGSLKYGAHSAGNVSIASRLGYYNHLITLFRNLNCATLPGWLVYSLNSKYQSKDCLHPNTDGYKLIAGTIIDLLNGGAFYPQAQWWTWTLTNHTTGDSYLNFVLNETSMNINAKLNYVFQEEDKGVGTAEASVSKLISLPDFFRAKEQQAIYLPSCVYLNNYYYTAAGYASIVTKEGVSWVNLYAHSLQGSATIPAKTTVTAIFNINLPLFGN